MAHFAKIEDNIVKQVIVIHNDSINNLDFPESEPLGQEFITSLGFSGEWLQTSYNGNFRGKYAGIGDIYDRVKNEFIHPSVEEVTNAN